MGYMLAFLSALCYSITNIVLKKGMSHSQYNGVWIITLINVIVLGHVLALAVIFGSLPNLNRTGVILFAVAGFLINVVGRSLLYSSIRINGSSKAVAIKNSAPAFTVLFAVVVLHEQITLWPWVGISLIMVGLLLLGVRFFQEGAKVAQRSGYWLALAAAVAYGLGQGLTKQAMEYMYEPILGVFLGCLTAFLFLSVIEAGKGNIRSFIRANFQKINKYYVCAGVLTSLALLLFYLSVSYILVSYSVAILAIDPVLTVILSKFFLKKEEKVSFLILIVAVLVFIGATIVSLMGS
ncbi:DMT family transporter [Alteribacter populi]|uniref:DMT family transporter n=1 Tax=Alteribacter populi TaxID=2011011 RepID=UPI000BBB15FB|nr:DMT family transporter [Alteribacter populi]